MIDGTYYVDCACGSSEHTLRFTVDKQEKEIYTGVFLNDRLPWYRRVWKAAQYVFGYKCKYGHWDCTLLDKKKCEDLRTILNIIIEETE